MKKQLLNLKNTNDYINSTNFFNNSSIVSFLVSNTTDANINSGPP